MFDYDKITLSIRDYNDNNVGTLYAPLVKSRNFAYDIQAPYDSNGWKELRFSISNTVDGEPNP